MAGIRPHPPRRGAPSRALRGGVRRRRRRARPGAPAGPVNQAPPTITRSGDTLSTDSGSWVGAENYTYDWLRCTGTTAASCGKPVTGAIEPTYRLTHRGCRLLPARAR